MSPAPIKLEQLERWMFEVITHPDGVEAGFASSNTQNILGAKCIEEVATPGPNLSAADRLRVYADMYFWRLQGVLDDEFPHVASVLGKESFAEVSKQYLVCHPSKSPNLAHLGLAFPKFIESLENSLDDGKFLGQLAYVEAAISRSFDAEEKAGIAPEVLTKINPAEWSNIGLDMIPASALIESDFPVNDFIVAQGKSQDLQIPKPKKSWLLIHRQDFTVWRLPLSEAQYTILKTLSNGGTLMDSMEKAADLAVIDFDSLVNDVGTWFQDWTGIGLFSALNRAD